MAKEYTKKHIGKRTFEDVKKYVEWQSQGKCNVLSAKPEQRFDDLGVDVCVWNVKTDTDGDWWVVEGDGVPIALRLIEKNAATAGRENVHHWFLCKPALGGQKPLAAIPIRASFCRRIGACRSCSQPLFRISWNQGVTHTTLQAKSCAKGVLPLACRLGQVLQNALHFEVATGDPHPFGNLRETPINCAARPRPVH